MAAIDIGPGTLDLENLVADSPHTLRIEATADGSPYVPTSVVMKFWTQTGQLLATITAAIVDGAAELDLAALTASADSTRSSVLRHQVKADGVPWLKGTTTVRPESDGKGGAGSATTAQVTVVNGQSTASISVVSVGPPGPQGDPAGPSSYVSGEAISGHTAVSVGDDGLLFATDRTDPLSTQRCVGITTGAVAMGENAVVVTIGAVVEESWSWAPGPVWVGPDGVLTQTVPVSPALLVEVGVALTSTSLFVRTRSPLVLA